MEDHLRNKNRLDQEWQALCAYEAEPSNSTLIALQVSCWWDFFLTFRSIEWLVVIVAPLSNLSLPPSVPLSLSLFYVSPIL